LTAAAATLSRAGSAPIGRLAVRVRAAREYVHRDERWAAAALQIVEFGLDLGFGVPAANARRNGSKLFELVRQKVSSFEFQASSENNEYPASELAGSLQAGGR